MTKLLTCSLLAAGLAVGFGSSARALVLDFEAFQHGGVQNLFPSPFQTDGYEFIGNQVVNDYAIVGSASAEFLGSTTLIPFNNETHTFSRIDGQPFNLLSFQYSERTTDPAATVLFTGNFAGGGSIGQNVTTDGVFGFETANFVGFNNLSSVVFTFVSGISFQLDNIEVTAVPEPATGLLICLGLGAVLFARRRTRSGR